MRILRKPGRALAPEAEVASLFSEARARCWRAMPTRAMVEAPRSSARRWRLLWTMQADQLPIGPGDHRSSVGSERALRYHPADDEAWLTVAWLGQALRGGSHDAIEQGVEADEAL